MSDLGEQYRAIQRFIAEYGQATRTTIEVIPRHQASQFGLSRGNWGRWDEVRGRIFIHEDVFTQSHLNAVREIGHEVGAAELNRVFGVPKAAIPAVTDPPPGISYLTHVIDSLL